MFTKSGDLRGTPEDLGTLSWSTPWYFNWQDIKHAQNVINFINLGGLQAPRSKKKKQFLDISICQPAPRVKIELQCIKMAAVSTCLLLLQPYWTIQNDILVCGSNSQWTGPSLTEGWRSPEGSCVFCESQHFFLKPFLILCTIYFSRVPFIQISTAHFIQRFNHQLPREREGSLGEI